MTSVGGGRPTMRPHLRPPWDRMDTGQLLRQRRVLMGFARLTLHSTWTCSECFGEVTEITGRWTASGWTWRCDSCEEAAR